MADRADIIQLTHCFFFEESLFIPLLNLPRAGLCQSNKVQGNTIRANIQLCVQMLINIRTTVRQYEKVAFIFILF